MMRLPLSLGQRNKLTIMLKILLAEWARAGITAKHVRHAVFINEQKIAEEDEWDEHDENALHLVASLDGNPIGTARLTSDGIVGRMAVLDSFRNQGTGSAMMEQIIKTAKKSRMKELKLHAQRPAEGFYTKHGFIAEGEEFMEAGIPHIAMKLELMWQ
jgi:predicted GNAT family N-acyltransferase